MSKEISQKRTTFIASLGLLLVTIIWGFAFVVVKNSLDIVPPIYMMAFRFTIATAGLIILFFKKLIKMTKSELIHGVIIGLCLFAAYAFQTIGLVYTTAGKNAFLTTFYVILVPFINWIIVKRKPDFYSILAAFISIVGIGLLSLRGDLTMNIGDILTLICGICYALQIVYIAHYSQHDSPIVLTVIQLAVAAILSWIIAPFYDGAFPTHAFSDKSVIISMLYLGIFSSMIAFLLQTVCQKYTPPSTASIIMSFEAVFGVLFGVLFLHEGMTIRTTIGCILMFVAVIISETKLSFLHKKPNISVKNEK